MKVDFTKLYRAFNPECVAVVGSKKDDDYRWLRAQSEFKGKLYSVQINAEAVEDIKAMGIENYTSLRDIPEPIDLVIIAVPRAVAPQILEDCIFMKVAAAHFYTSGFSETDTEEGRKIERLLVDMATRANFLLIGPNCMGIYNPRLGLKQVADQATSAEGPVGFISQSGNHSVKFSLEAHLQGVDVTAVSFGNGVVLDSADYLEYLSRDDSIKVIGMYLEGVKDGRRFFSVLKEVAAKKPVVIWKGGRTEVGERAIASHTASLAVSQPVWDAAVRQAGAMKVSNSDELVDTLKALLYLPPVKGSRVGLAGGSGGQSVAISDAFAEAGMEIPLLTQPSYDELATFFRVIGGSYRNPIDPNVNRKHMKRILEILERDSNIDNVVLAIDVQSRRTDQLGTYIDSIINIKNQTKKPVMAIIVCLFSPGWVKLAREVMQRLQSNGIPAFISPERGAHALSSARNYYLRRNGVEMNG